MSIRSVLAAPIDVIRLTKSYAMVEAMHLDSRCEVLNLLNGVTFSTSITNPRSLAFGKVPGQTSTAGQMEAGLKLYG